MGTRSLIAILRKANACRSKSVKEFLSHFCIWQYCQWDGQYECEGGAGQRIVDFLQNLMDTDKWDEFVGYLDNIQIVQELEEAFPEFADPEKFDRAINGCYDSSLSYSLNYDDPLDNNVKVTMFLVLWFLFETKCIQIFLFWFRSRK